MTKHGLWTDKMTVFYWIYMFWMGGTTYQITELFWAHKTHFSMFFAGGISVVGIVAADMLFSARLSVFSLALIGCLVITFTELIFGLMFNKALHMKIWDYSTKKFNLFGQICLQNSIYWYILSFPAIFAGRFVRNLLNIM